jgi:hypothetical protein
MVLPLLLAGVWVASLFSVFLPSSASLLAPTTTLTPTVTSTPTATPTPTSTFTPLPPILVTPELIEAFPFEVYDQHQVWESAVGKMVLSEDFEKDGGFGEMLLPYWTGDGFLLSGKSNAQILADPELLGSGKFLHLLSGKQGLTFTFPDGRAVTAFGFDYTTSAEWHVTVINLDVILSRGRNQFVGIIIHQNSATKFNLVSSAGAQGGLSVDNISYTP